MDNRHPRRSCGVTLIELLIVVLIVGILAGIAVPSYTKYVAAARRADAESVLMEAVHFMERYYTENNTYATASLPAGLTEAPKDGSTKYYDLAIASQSGTAYSLEATPKGSMAGDRCGVLTIDNTGVKGADDSVSFCWKQ